MAKPTISCDGKYRIEIRIARRVSTADLANYLASALRHVGIERLHSIADGLPAKAVRDQVRTEMERRGVDYIDGWSDQFDMVETIDRLAIATEQIRRAYPELAKAEDSKTTPLAPLVTKLCMHGNEPSEDVQGDPIAECAKADGGTEWGAFNPEGCFYAYDCAVDVANEAAKESTTEDDIIWGRKCREHEDERAETCSECYAEDGPPVCTACKRRTPSDELKPGPSGDPHCPDCLATFDGQDDDAEYRAYAYH